MIWIFADITTTIADNLWVQYGALGIIIIGMAIALVYFVKKADRIQAEKDLLQDKRLDEAREAAQAALIPFEELTRFIRTLYDISINKKGE